MVSKPFPVSERYNFFTRLLFWVIRCRIRKRNSLAFRALKNVISDRDEKKKTKQNRTRNREQGITNEKIWHCLMQKKKKNDFGEI